MKTPRYSTASASLVNSFARICFAQAAGFCVALLALLLAVAGPVLAQCSATSSDGYSVSVTIEPTSIVPSSNSCQYGYNYNLRFNYTIAFSGPNAPASLYTLQATFGCSNANGNMHSAQLPTTAGSGTMTTATNQYRPNSDCQTASIASLGCGLIDVHLEGPGLNTTITCNYSGRSAPLPVTLTAFTAIRQAAQVDVAWTTATEVDNALFTVEQSADGRAWQPATEVPGAGTTLVAHSYRASVPARAASTYYRLRMTDTSGKATFSSVVVVAAAKTALLTLAPNPNTGRQVAIQGLDFQSPVELTLTDPLGRPCYHATLTSADVTLPALPAGLYLAQLRTGAGQVAVVRYVQQ